MVSQMMRFPKAALRFRPLGGIVLCILLPNSLLWRFRPLTGMVRLCESWWPALVCFRPLTGMVPTLVINSNGTPKFSPPYGDGTSSTSTISSVQTGFRPLTGMVPKKSKKGRNRVRFRPLTGMVLLCCGIRTSLNSFRPLTGMVL